MLEFVRSSSDVLSPSSKRVLVHHDGQLLTLFIWSATCTGRKDETLAYRRTMTDKSTSKSAQLSEEDKLEIGQVRGVVFVQR